MALDIVKEVGQLQTMYKNSASANKRNFLIYGGTGSGKTHLTITCPKPILYDSFDPGGTNTIKPEIDAGWIIADNRWEKDDPNAPTAFEAWSREHQRRKREGFYSVFGTYVGDSLTTLSQIIMAYVLKKAGRAGGVPFQQDWLPQMTALENVVKDILSLPCNVVFTAHPDSDKDEATGRMFVGPLVTGRLKIRLPLLFDEIYYLEAKETSNGVDHTLLTRPTGLFQARTRMGRQKFDLREKADIKYLLGKAGLEITDKEIPWIETK